MRHVLLVLLIAASLSGCAAEVPTWRAVDLDGLSPSTVTGLDDSLLVAGERNSAPALDRISSDGDRENFRLIPHEPYARTASLHSAAVLGDQLTALGVQTGGAHGNPRWTVWQGTLAAAELTNHPQSFFTFGGHDAGPLLGVASLADQPVIVGSRTTSTGSRLVIYTVQGTTWSAPTASPEVVSSNPTRELGFSAVANAGALLVIAGDDLSLHDGLQQRPVIWVGTDTQHWTEISLPEPAQGTGLALATGVACTGAHCWVVGWVHGTATAWQVTFTADAQATVSAPITLAGEASNDTSPSALVALSDGRPVVAVNAAQPGISYGCRDGSWRNWNTPGEISALATTSNRVAIISATQLWEAAIPNC
ncbi:MAG TPA: hypothetical protein PKD84_13110 [Propionicimonas sp.]|nr:hypothetical protein [Propionicimonas sp.]